MSYAKLAKDLDEVLNFLWGIGVQKAFHETVASAIQVLLSTDEEIATYEAKLARLREIMAGAGCVQMDGVPMNDRLTDELISVMKQILSELHGIRGALHPCEHVFEHKTHAEPCDCRADRLVDGCWLCETHAKIVEDWEKKPKRT